MIRDAEIEATLERIVDPILRVSGLSPAQVRIYLIDNPDLNAFVAGGDNIFLHTGLLQRLETVDQVRAVVAHEVGHITGGHLFRRNEQIRAASGTVGLGVLLAIAAAASGNAELAIGAGLTSSQVAERSLLSHNRAEEASADQAALRYMEAAGADPQAILEVMALFRGQEYGADMFADPYVRTHPLWSDRLRFMREGVGNARPGTAPDPGTARLHARMRAKLDGFLEPPSETLRRRPDDGSEAALLARAIAWHRLPDIARARAAMAVLLAAHPDDPYYHELAGQFALESGRARDAVAAYRRAAELAPHEPLILSGLGRALIALDTPAATEEALQVLTRARRIDKADARALANLAIAYARLNRPADASLATAERYMLSGQLRDAGIHAARAARAFPQGAPGWRQAEDILRVVRRATSSEGR
nr:M48 family metalloprotease [Halovulum dunhuangense]